MTEKKRRPADAVPAPRRRGAPKKDDPKARQLIVATAARLFYSQGIRAIGVDTIAEKSGVSKTTLYRQFESKDALVAAVLERWDENFWAWWDALEAKHPGDPRTQLRDAMTGLAAQISESSFCGCPFLKFASEFPSEEVAGWAIARANKARLKARFLALLERMKTPQADKVADQLLMLVNGAYATGAMRKPQMLRDLLIDATMKLTD